MNKSAIFKAAHALTKATIQAGDSYAVTFGAALRIVISESKVKVLGVCVSMGDVKRSPNAALNRMIESSKNYIAWRNIYADAWFVCSRATVEKLVKNKRVKLEDGEVVKISNGATVDEYLLEMDAKKVDSVLVKQGFEKEAAEISRTKLNLLSEVLYNSEFDASILFN